MRKKYLSAGLILLFCLLIFGAKAQKPKRLTSADIHEAIQKLNFLGSALYVAAHPDDENTRLIAYLANEVKANTAYLSMTRGDGGQNLIGTEIQELLGVIRTQELLAARRVDGGNQMFTRANDFGFSKHPDETLDIWNKDKVLADVVWAIRKWQPDVIINRFQHEYDPNWAGRMHGHHTASAMLSHEAFDLAADKSVYPEQLSMVEPWQPRRLFFNTTWWFYGSRENFEKADKSRMLGVDVGVYYPIKGKSNTEIAAESRSMHKCQGFGSSGSRGRSIEYVELLKGDMPKDKEDLFEGINTTWTRVKGGAPIGKLLSEVDKEFRYEEPYASVPKLMKAYKLIKALPDGYWKRVKLAEVKTVIKGCLALFAEAVAEDVSATPGQDVALNLEIINRSPIPVSLEKVTFYPSKIDSVFQEDLENNQPLTFSKTIQLAKDMEYTNAYWLQEKWALGMYTVEQQKLRGLPETPKPLKVKFELKVDGELLDFTTDVVYKKTDPVEGEVYQPFEITPPIFANVAEKVYIYANDAPQTVSVLLKAGQDSLTGTLELCHGNKWRVEPEKIEFNLKQKGEEQRFAFKLFPPEDQDENFIVPLVRIGEETYDRALVMIEYDHIPTQTVLKDASAKVVKIDLKKAGEKIGYIMGAGDEIPNSLEQIGYDVSLLEDRDITLDNLKKYDAVILGIRAYNTVDRLKFHQEKLMKYVEQGGTMLVQYNTAHRLQLPSEQIAPYPLTLSRDRVTVEEAEVRILKPDHSVMTYPNKITEKDFEGWIQERGLYFPNEWDEHFEAILSSNDPDETPKDGGLLVAKYGEGHYIYTGYSWFRELPAGVPGAFRIFTNLISIGQRPRP